MARAVDADVMLAELKPIDYEAEHSAVLISDVAKIMREWVERQPTLTPPNEALTLEELREMDGEPVWVDDEKTWAILQVWDDQNIDAVFPIQRGCFREESVLGMKIYRRPPEGEEYT